MLKKRYRLPVQRLRAQKGETTRSRYFLLKVFPSERTHSRFGVVISKKVYAKATERNRLKRIIASYLRQSEPGQPHDYVIIVNPAAHVLTDKNDIIKELNTIFKPYA